MARESSERSDPGEEELRSPSTGSGEEAGDTGPELDRLPPPAFPPGSRRSAAARSGVAGESATPGPEDEGDDEFPDEAFISPDDPIRHQARGIPDDAFISPDDPFVAAEDGTVTGVGEPAPGSQAGGRSGAPTIHELPYLLDRVAEQIQEAGEKALRPHPEMGHFEAALKSFLRGYLQGGSD